MRPAAASEAAARRHSTARGLRVELHLAAVQGKPRPPIAAVEATHVCRCAGETTQIGHGGSGRKVGRASDKQKKIGAGRRSLACQAEGLFVTRTTNRRKAMELGYFTMPSHPPERPLKDGHEWDLQVIGWLDELGYKECWIGEHHTAPWEPHPAPDLLVAQALMTTKRIRIGPGGFLLPYHHPAELANRVAMLDHISGGRLNFGIAASGLPSDWAMFNVDGEKGANREMTREALDIILKLWSTNEPFEHVGNFWTVRNPEVMYGFLKPHIKPLQKPFPPIGVAGLSKGSDTLKLAGERGYLPMSLNLNPAYVGSHWEAVEIGAAKTGRKPNRAEWRMVREVFVADTDAEAMRLSVGLHMGRMMREYFLPLLKE